MMEDQEMRNELLKSKVKDEHARGRITVKSQH